MMRRSSPRHLATPLSALLSAGALL